MLSLKEQQRLVELARLALVAHLGARQLRAGIFDRLRFGIGKCDTGYRIDIGTRPDRDLQQPELLVGTIELGQDGSVIAVKLTPEAEAARGE